MNSNDRNGRTSVPEIFSEGCFQQNQGYCCLWGVAQNASIFASTRPILLKSRVQRALTNPFRVRYSLLVFHCNRNKRTKLFKLVGSCSKCFNLRKYSTNSLEISCEKSPNKTLLSVLLAFGLLLLAKPVIATSEHEAF